MTDLLLQDVLDACKAAHREGAGDDQAGGGAAFALALPETLKKSQRVIEKAALRHTGKGDVSVVKDVVRGLVMASDMENLTRALQFVLEKARQPDPDPNLRIQLVLSKDRFAEPTAPPRLKA